MSDDVKRLREEYENSLDEAEAKRTAYHAAIRRLYMSGIPLREIAELLDLSHQRVHKIVGIEPEKRKKARQKGIDLIVGLLVLLTVGSFSLTTAIFSLRVPPGFKSVWVSAWVDPEVQEEQFLESVAPRIGRLPKMDISFDSPDEVTRDMRDAGIAVATDATSAFVQIKAPDQSTAGRVSQILETTPRVRDVSEHDLERMWSINRIVTGIMLLASIVCLVPAGMLGHRLIAKR